jgi:hypothetical protein
LALKHFAEDLENFKNAATLDNYPMPVQLEKNKGYFLGFCEHKKIDNVIKYIPQYGMLFQTNEANHREETFYVGKVNAEGMPDTNKGIKFADLNF